MKRSLLSLCFTALYLSTSCGGEDDALPMAPTELMVAPGSPAPSVHLTWKDNALNESHFVVERKSGTGTFEMVRNMIPFDPNQNVNQYHDNKVVSGVAYTYRVSAVAMDGKRTFSAASSITLL